MASTKRTPNKTTPAVPAGLALAETVLVRLKALAEGTELWWDSSINTNEMLGPGKRFADLVLDSECPKSEGYNRFLDKHWQAAAGAKSDSTNFFVARDAEPKSLTLRTFARLDYLRALTAFANALDGLPVELSEDRSWTWDHQVKTSKDRPLHRTAYLLHIGLTATKPFKASAWLKTAGEDICASEDPRADRCVMQLMEEADISYGSVFSYGRTKGGFELECEDEKVAERVKQGLFADCQVKTTRGRTRHDPTLMQVRLP